MRRTQSQQIETTAPAAGNRKKARQEAGRKSPVASSRQSDLFIALVRVLAEQAAREAFQAAQTTEQDHEEAPLVDA